MSQSIDIYLTYCAMKAHFGKGDYDFVKFNGKTKVSRDSFWKRKDRVWFVMLGRKLNSYLIESVEDYLLANFLVETKGYIGNFNEPKEITKLVIENTVRQSEGKINWKLEEVID